MKGSRFGMLVWIFLLITLLSIISNFGIFGPPGQPTLKVEYGELMKQIEAGNIKVIRLGNTGYIEGEFLKPLNDKFKFTAHTFPLYQSDARAMEEAIKSKNPEAKVELVQEQQGVLMPLIMNYGPTLLIFGLMIFFIRSVMQKSNGGMSQFVKAKTRLASASGKDKKTFADVAGIDEAKEELKEIIEFLKTPQKFQKLGGRIPKGVLLIGPPGTGKTLLAQAVAGEANVPFFSMSGSDFVEMFVGVGAGRVRDLFEQGKKNAPCIIFIDELDAVGRHRGAGLGGSHDEREQTLNQLLVEMGGFETNSGVIMIGATNRPDVLDPALLRPGRFDRRVVVNKPDIKGRFEILEVHSKKIPLDENVDLNIVAKGTPGFTGADLANLLNEAALEAAKNNNPAVTAKDLETAKDKVLMGSERRSMIISPKEKRTTAIHEAGHAIVAALVEEADPIHKVTIIPRGMSLGSTWQLPEEDQHNYSKTQLTSQLAILMGGRAAEDEYLKQFTTGASNDIDRAMELATRMVCEWGMSEIMGPQKFGNEAVNPFLGKQLSGRTKDYSEDTAQKIDSEIKNLVDNAYTIAKNLLSYRSKEMELIVKALDERETIDGAEVYSIVRKS